MYADMGTLVTRQPEMQKMIAEAIITMPFNEITFPMLNGSEWKTVLQHLQTEIPYSV